MADFHRKGYSQYGSWMGRKSDLDPNTEAKLHLQRVPLNGDYDPGGAYWGSGQPLYCAWDDDGNVRYLRADSREDAKAQFPKARWFR
jgi:hypothetical protein